MTNETELSTPLTPVEQVSAQLLGHIVAANNVALANLYATKNTDVIGAHLQGLADLSLMLADILLRRSRGLM